MSPHPLTIFAFLVLAAGPFATSFAAADREAQVDAATLAARQRLAEIVAEEVLDPARGVSVGDYFDRMRAGDRYYQVIGAAQRVGGVRWIDDQTCQVRLELDGDLLAEMILTLALAEPNRTPVPYGRLESRLRHWHRRSFSATGFSVTIDRAVQLSESAAAWRALPVDARRSAVLSARDDAGRRAVEAMAASDPGLADDAPRRAELMAWAADQPVTGVRFGEDRTVELSLAVPASMRETDAGRPPPPPSIIVTGRARAEAIDGPQPPRPAAVAPAEPPSWATESIEAEGVAEPAGRQSPLKTARAAELAAAEQLRGRIAQLAWGSGSVGEAAAADRAVADAIDRLIAAARVVRVDYRSDGSVSVRLAVDGRSAWKALGGTLPPPDASDPVAPPESGR